MIHDSALVYLVSVLLWIAVVAAVYYARSKSDRDLGAAKLLLAIIAIVALKNVTENIYFCIYFNEVQDRLPNGLNDILGRPGFLLLPELLNIATSITALFFLLLRWLPRARREHERSEDKLGQAERRFALLVDSVKEYAIFLLDPVGGVTSWNAGAERIKGYAAGEVMGKHISIFYPTDEQDSGAPLRALEIAERDGTFEADGQRLRKDGTSFWAHIVINAIRDDAGRLIGFAKVIKDITDAKAAQEQLTRRAHFDHLTGLPNRNSLFRDLDQLDAGCSSFGNACVALVDFDDFKRINELVGHTGGDALLIEAARRLERTVGPAGRVYRLGSDEFAIVIGSQGRRNGTSTVMTLLTSALQSVEVPFEVSGHRISVRASVGVTTTEEVGTDHAHIKASDLIARADLAIHDAKNTGLHKISWFRPALRERVAARRMIETELQQAYFAGEFELYYQPQIRLRDGVVVGAEALIRWRHPSRGVLGPTEFIDSLEQSPVAAKVGDWILRSACDMAASWQSETAPPLRIGVNLFSVQFTGDPLVTQVIQALNQAGLPPKLLELEITEKIALGRDEDILPSLHSLRAMGVGLAFDDFGTGYASLSYLTHYPLTRIKIDRSFVGKISQSASPRETAIVRCMIMMGHSLGFEITAEGAETAEQIAYLADLRCDEVQGYYYSKPLPAVEFKRFLVNHRMLKSGIVASSARLRGRNAEEDTHVTSS